MTTAECEILADAALQLREIIGRLSDRRNIRDLGEVYGKLATLPLTNEGD